VGPRSEKQGRKSSHTSLLEVGIAVIQLHINKMPWSDHDLPARSGITGLSQSPPPSSCWRNDGRCLTGSPCPIQRPTRHSGSGSAGKPCRAARCVPATSWTIYGRGALTHAPFALEVLEVLDATMRSEPSSPSGRTPNGVDRWRRPILPAAPSVKNCNRTFCSDQGVFSVIVFLREWSNKV
jgi:hypothetical protein